MNGLGSFSSKGFQRLNTAHLEGRTSQRVFLLYTKFGVDAIGNEPAPVDPRVSRERRWGISSAVCVAICLQLVPSAADVCLHRSNVGTGTRRCGARKTNKLRKKEAGQT